MSPVDKDKNAPAKPEVIVIESSESMAQHLMQQTRLDTAIEIFAFQKPFSETEGTLSEAEFGLFLREFTDKITLLSTQGDHYDSDAIKQAFDIVAAEMNRVTNEKMGTVAKQRSRLIKKFLQMSADIPYERRVVTGFTTEEWDKQFKPELEALSSKPSEKEVAKEYIYGIFKGFALSPFSQVPYANRWA